MQWLHNILALAPCGLPQGDHFAHVPMLLQWLPARVHFTNLKCHVGFDLPTRLCVCHINEIETVSMLEPWLAGRQPKG